MGIELVLMQTSGNASVLPLASALDKTGSARQPAFAEKPGKVKSGNLPGLQGLQFSPATKNFYRLPDQSPGNYQAVLFHPLNPADIQVSE